jgi:hypothetical protein
LDFILVLSKVRRDSETEIEDYDEIRHTTANEFSLLHTFIMMEKHFKTDAYENKIFRSIFKTFFLKLLFTVRSVLMNITACSCNKTKTNDKRKQSKLY